MENVAPTLSNGSADVSPGDHHVDDRELLLRAVEGAKLAAEEASRAASRVEVLRVELGALKKLVDDLVAHEDGRRLESAELRQIIGEAPKSIDVARAELQGASADDVERWQRTHGLRSQVALALAVMRGDAAAAVKQRRMIGLATVAAGLLPELLRSFGGH